MKFFTCLLDPEDRGIPDTVRRAYESLPRSRALDFQWQSFNRAAVLTGWDDPYGDPLVAHDGDYVVVGTVRLDNRAELERWSERSGRGLSDLELVLSTVARCGTKYVPQFLGDFAFVVWNAATRTAVVACDAFMIKHLYYTERRGLFAFASRAEALALEDRYEAQYLAERVSFCKPSPTLTVYAGVHPVPESTVAVLKHGRLTMRSYWSPYDFEPEPVWVKAEREAAETCRDLLIRSVQLRLSGRGDTWAQLSGGTDSSSIASVAQWLVERGTIAHGLAGTVTYVDRQGTGTDEREYSDPVVSQWRLRNEMIIDPPLWFDDQHLPPRSDQPRDGLPFYPRERRLCAIVRGAGGRVLLTGVGGDELFTGTMFFFADWLARGRVWPAVREMARWAAIGRVSFWELAYRNALVPLLPGVMQRRLARDDVQLIPWVLEATARRYELHARAVAPSSYAGRIGHKYQHAVASILVGFGRTMGYEGIENTLDVRHPFLYRPLVEFALRLPPELCARPQERKWVLREAMRGILPDAVRKRVGKSDSTERFVWTLATQRPLLEPLVRNPILADLGVIDAMKLRTSFDAAPRERRCRNNMHSAVLRTLAFEAWLQMRSGRWPRGGHLSSAS